MNPAYTEEEYGDLSAIPASNFLHQPINVEAAFLPAEYFDRPKSNSSAVAKKRLKVPPKCIPQRFITESGREVIISEIGLIHPKFNGMKTQFLFDVTDGASDYRLSFDTETLEWFLEWQGDEYI